MFYLILWTCLKTRHAEFSHVKYANISEKTSDTSLTVGICVNSGVARIVQVG